MLRKDHIQDVVVAIITLIVVFLFAAVIPKIQSVTLPELSITFTEETNGTKGNE